MRVALVSMPFASLDRPPLGVCLLQAGLRSRGIECDAHFLSLAFSRSLGRGSYELISSGLPFPALVGDWVFSACLFGQAVGGEYIRDVLLRQWRLSAADLREVLRARDKAASFLDEAMASVPWGDYDVIGFSSFGMQNLAALSLARRIKEAHPGVLVVFGGSNWHGVMGEESLRRFPFVDAAFTGEADETFPEFVARLGGNQPLRMQDLPGVLTREGGGLFSGPPARPVEDLDALPYPEFEDYYDALAATGHDRLFVPALAAESSRGCWWAASRPCLFCGLNGPERRFRAKSPGRCLAEFRSITERWPCSLLDLVDNIVAPRFLTEVLPELAEHPLPVPLFMEVRPGVDRAVLPLMGRANVTLQAGIESLSNEVLGLMGKGCDVLENLRLLKSCREFGVCVYWNIIYGFPGESDGAYEEMEQLLPAITFLNPPDECGPLALERFSPYFEAPERYGISDPHPATPFRHIYPFADDVLARMVPTFEYDYASGSEPSTAITSFREALTAWQTAPDVAGPRLRGAPDGTATLVDGRAGGLQSEQRLDSMDAFLCSSCEVIRSRSEIEDLMRARLGPGSVADVDARLGGLVERRLLIEREGRYLSLTVWDGDPV